MAGRPKHRARVAAALARGEPPPVNPRSRDPRAAAERELERQCLKGLVGGFGSVRCKRRGCKRWSVWELDVCTSHGGLDPGRLEELRDRLGSFVDYLDPNKLLVRAHQIIDADIGMLLDDAGKVLPVSEWPRDVFPAIASVKVVNWNADPADSKTESAVEIRQVAARAQRRNSWTSCARGWFALGRRRTARPPPLRVPALREGLLSREAGVAFRIRRWRGPARSGDRRRLGDPRASTRRPRSSGGGLPVTPPRSVPADPPVPAIPSVPMTGWTRDEQEALLEALRARRLAQIRRGGADPGRRGSSATPGVPVVRRELGEPLAGDRSPALNDSWSGKGDRLSRPWPEGGAVWPWTLARRRGCGEPPRMPPGQPSSARSTRSTERGLGANSPPPLYPWRRAFDRGSAGSTGASAP